MIVRSVWRADDLPDLAAAALRPAGEGGRISGLLVVGPRGPLLNPLALGEADAEYKFAKSVGRVEIVAGERTPAAVAGAVAAFL